MTGETSQVRENGATSGVGVLAVYSYDDRGRRTSLTRGNGTVLSYGYDHPRIPRRKLPRGRGRL